MWNIIVLEILCLKGQNDTNLAEKAKSLIQLTQHNDPTRCPNPQLLILLINHGNRTEWSPIRSVIIQAITKLHSVLLQINRNNYNFPQK